MDITHGFRHQPVLASFMVMLLRWLRGAKKVELYYGALEMKGNKSHCPVLKLPLCNDLLEATEAVAIVEQTGIYRHLGDCVFPSAKARLGEVAFADEMNTEARKLATEIREELRAARDAGTLAPLQSSLTGMFDDALGWAAEDPLAKRLKHKAEFSFRRGQYFRAIMLLWEAVLVADCDKFGITDSTDYDSREDAEKRLRSRLPIKDEMIFLKLKFLRNAIAHGTPPKIKGVYKKEQREAAQALASTEKLGEIFKGGRDLVESLINSSEPS